VRAQPSSRISELKLHAARKVFANQFGPNEVKNTSAQKKIAKIKAPQGAQLRRPKENGRELPPGTANRQENGLNNREHQSEIDGRRVL
jgi:hypothetical protein